MPTTLIVEDEPTIMSLARSLSGDLGHETLTAHNAIEALALVEGDTPIDLLFTDINLGTGPTGLEFAQTARGRRPDLKVLYTSGQAMTDGMMSTMVEGSLFMSKPYTPEELQTSITAALQALP
jgi:CheY-like chemotaxis protein